jgi:hypothetical protein
MKKYMLTDKSLFEAIDRDFGPVPGIYRLHALDESGEFVRLRRLLDDDPQGILYIGTSTQLVYRVMSLLKSVSAA